MDDQQEQTTKYDDAQRTAETIRRQIQQAREGAAADLESRLQSIEQRLDAIEARLKADQ